jgi:hypothetical protein
VTTYLDGALLSSLSVVSDTASSRLGAMPRSLAEPLNGHWPQSGGGPVRVYDDDCHSEALNEGPAMMG